MTTICKACNSTGYGMINIFSHPNNIDGMFTSLTEIQIIENDCLCIPCYDEMKIAYLFRQKCFQSQILRQASAGQTKIEEITVPKHSVKVAIAKQEEREEEEHIQEDVIEPHIDHDELNLKEDEISTTSMTASETIEVEEDIELKTELSTTNYIERLDTDEELDDDDDEDERIEYENDDDEVAQKIDYQEFKKDKEETDDLNHDSDGDDKQLLPPPFLVWKCYDCHKSFIREGNFKKHIKIHLKTLSTAVTSTRTRKKRAVTPKYIEEDILQGIHESQCEFCFAEFQTALERQTHERVHCGEIKPYKCPFDNCTSTFKDKYAVRNHVRIHSDVKRYKCRYCDHRFHQRGNIISHERLHTGEKPFLCPYCGRGFAESGNLKAHIRFHTGERPYTCTQCDKSFKTHYAHKIHFRTHTKERPYLCSECGKSFASSGKLVVHKRIHTGQRPYKCVDCPSAFVNSTGLKRHAKIHSAKTSA